MDERQRYMASLTFGQPDKVSFEPGGPRESTLARWHREGLPADRNYLDYLCEILGVERPVVSEPVDPGISFRMIPEFPETILEHRDGHYIVQEWSGAIVEISDRYDVTYLRQAKDFVTRKWHRFPVQNEQNWQDMKKRYQALEPQRLPGDFLERCERLRGREYPVSIAFAGPFWQLREWCGLENLCVMMIDQPDVVHEMAAFWTEFVAALMDRFLPHFCPDRVMIQEDMAYKAHSMISPAMARRFLLPAYQEWLPRLKQAGCPVLDLDSDGYVADLIPLWIEAGFNCCSPMEVAAGNDLLALRRAYGRSMAFRGGIDKRLLARGGQPMLQELQRLIPPMLELGGYIPSCDHGVPDDISWTNFVEYGRGLARLTGWL